MRKRITEAAAESLENNAAMTPEQLRRKRKGKQRHVHLRVVAGSAAGAVPSSRSGSERTSVRVHVWSSLWIWMDVRELPRCR